MDRRQQKTKAAIYEAFSRLLEKKSYNHITIQRSSMKRTSGAAPSTLILRRRTICCRIYANRSSVMFSLMYRKRKRITIFQRKTATLADKLTHLLYHLKEQRNDILVLLSGESGDLFLQYFKTASRPLFTEYAASASPSVPEDFALNHYVSSFAEAVKWWAGGGMRISPEKVVAYYLALIK